MKRKNLYFGALGLAALSAVITFYSIGFNNEKGLYEQSDLSVFTKQSATDAQKWLAARYIDAETGEKISNERLQEIYQLQKTKKRSSLVFEELGPDNIGGRTRAILPDRINTNVVYAGGVSGGLFKSENRAQSWTRVDEFPGLPYISSMAQTQDGTIFVATGNSQESWGGNGMYYKTLTSSEWVLVPGTDAFSTISEVVCAPNSNTIYFTNPSGLKKWAIGDASVSNVTVGTGAGGCQTVQISNDGSVIVVAMSTSKTFISENGGVTFTPVWGTDMNQVPTSAPLIQFAISPNKNSSNKYTIYASRTDGNLLSMHASLDNGLNWSKIAGQADGTSNLDIYRDQGTYNSILSVTPNNTQRLLIGGIDVWDWNQTTSNPVYGGFERLSFWAASPTSSIYVHADNHEMKWDNTNRLYIGNDGGIGISDNFGETFYPANIGYNVTQFYGIAMDKEGRVMGGTQDNGTLYNSFSFNSYKNFIEVAGGDGFECEISFFNPKVMFSTIYYGALSRSSDNGFSFSDFVPTLPGTTWSTTGKAFHTEFVLAEYYDLNSRDSVTLFPRTNYEAGDVIKVASLSTGDTILYTTNKDLYYSSVVSFNPSLTQTDYKVTSTTSITPIDLGQTTYTIQDDVNPAGLSVGDSIIVNGTTIKVQTAQPYQHYFATSPNPNDPKILDMKDQPEVSEIPWDTVQVQDPYQSWLIIHNSSAGGGELYGTRDALRFSKDPTWVKLATGVGGAGGYESIDIEFSRDLSKCYVSCGNGVFRIDGLHDLYEQDFADLLSFRTACSTAGSLYNATTNPNGKRYKISNVNCEGIALNPSNGNDLLLLQQFGGTSSIIRRTINANVAAPTFTTLKAINMPCYDAIIDRDNPNIIVAGTAFGVLVSVNGADPSDPNAWQDASTGFDNVPVFEVRQNWRTWDEGCKRPGEIYLGTFGRGIWASSSLLGIDDDNSSAAIKKLKTNLKVYPNPVSDVTRLNFTLFKNSDVTIQVYNISGRLVKTIREKNVTKGDQTIDIDASDLSNGSYVVKFSAGSVNETIKFMKL